jgi:hypothetical protein
LHQLASVYFDGLAHYIDGGIGGQKGDHTRAFDGRAHALEGNHGAEITQNYAHEVGYTLLWLELKFQNDLILVHSRPFVTRNAQILKRLNRLLRGNITRV